MKTLSTPTSPSRMSSAVSVTPFGERLCVSMKLRTALPSPGAEAVLVRAAGAGRDAVDVAPHVLVGRLGPLQHEIEPEAVLVALRDSVNGASCTGRAARSREDLLQVVDEPFGVLERPPSAPFASSSKTIFSPLCR